MDTLALEIERTETPAWGTVDAIKILVNGHSLVDLTREVELPFAARDGEPTHAGSYVGLPPEAVFLPSCRFLGEPEDAWDDWEGRISVLGCGCGVVGCWPLQARITAREDVVVWEDFVQPHRRRWKHSALGPFVFDRDDYETRLQITSGPGTAC